MAYKSVIPKARFPRETGGLFLIVSLLFCYNLWACSKDEGPNAPIMQNRTLRITVGGRILTASLYDNPTTRDFIALLPLTVNLTDYAGVEKIFYPSTTLSTSERRAVSDPGIGDINVYAPWGNVAIFYGKYSASRDLIRMAKINGGMEVFSVPGNVNNVRFELVE